MNVSIVLATGLVIATEADKRGNLVTLATAKDGRTVSLTLNAN